MCAPILFIHHHPQLGYPSYLNHEQVHWDHVGYPPDFASSEFVIGHGSAAVLSGTSSASLRGSHSFFEADLLPAGRTIELSDPNISHQSSSETGKHEIQNLTLNWTQWQPIPSLEIPKALDVFNDGCLYLVDAPGH